MRVKIEVYEGECHPKGGRPFYTGLIYSAWLKDDMESTTTDEAKAGHFTNPEASNWAAAFNVEAQEKGELAMALVKLDESGVWNPWRD
jgi:hypothetical protein